MTDDLAPIGVEVKLDPCFACGHVHAHGEVHAVATHGLDVKFCRCTTFTIGTRIDSNDIALYGRELTAEESGGIGHFMCDGRYMTADGTILGEKHDWDEPIGS